MLELYFIFAVFDCLKLFLLLVLQFLAGPDGGRKKHEGNVLELGKGVAQGLASCGKAQARLHEVPGHFPVILVQIEGHEPEHRGDGLGPASIVPLFLVVLPLELTHIPEVVDLPGNFAKIFLIVPAISLKIILAGVLVPVVNAVHFLHMGGVGLNFGLCYVVGNELAL